MTHIPNPPHRKTWKDLERLVLDAGGERIVRTDTRAYLVLHGRAVCNSMSDGPFRCEYGGDGWKPLPSRGPTDKGIGIAGAYEYLGFAYMRMTDFVNQGEAIHSGEERPGPNYLPDPNIDDDPSIEWEAALQSLMWLQYNHPTSKAIQMAYGDDVFDRASAYAKEKSEQWDQCPLLFFSALDSDNRHAFVMALRDLYQYEARRWVRNAKRAKHLSQS